jgi:hypothetical protein
MKEIFHSESWRPIDQEQCVKKKMNGASPNIVAAIEAMQV